MVAKSNPSASLSEDLTTMDAERKQSGSHRQSPRNILWSLGIGLSLIAVGSLWISNQSEAPTADAETVGLKRILPVQTLRVKPVSSYAVSRSFTGKIAALRSSNVGFERSGTLVAALVEEGDRVTKGQSLAQIDVQNLQAQRQQLVAQQAQQAARLSELIEGARPEDIAAARAAVRDLEEQLRLQNVQKARRERLYKQGAIAREQLDEFTTGAASLNARIDQAKSNLQELLNGSRTQDITAQQAVVRQLEAGVADLDITIAKSTIAAPFTGVVAEKLMDEGTVVGAGEPVLRISESAAPEARIGVPVDVAQQLTIGEIVEVTLDEAQYRAKITTILPEVNVATRTQIVVLALKPELFTRVTPGQTVRVNLTERIPSDGYWLPTVALTQGIRGLWNCFVVVPASDTETGFEIEAQAVEIVYQEGDRVLVQGTLQPGDRIVASGTHRMVPGQAVDPIATSL